MAYLLDSNVFIEAKRRYYGFDFCPAFWDWLIEAANKELVFSVEKVRDELISGGDDLSEWARGLGEECFLPPDEATIQSLAAAVNPEDKFELVFRSMLERLFVERMDQNEEIFVRYMNDPFFRQVVTNWMASEAYRKLRTVSPAIEPPAGKIIPFRPPVIEPKPEERYRTCIPFVPLKAAAGAFGDSQHIEDDGFDWVAIKSRYRLRPGMFVAQVVGRSMEPLIPDGSYCLFRAPVEGTRQGKTVLVLLRDATDPETGQRFTVKRYESEKVKDGDSWRHARITLKPVNPDFKPIVLTGAEEGELQVVADLVEVLSAEAFPMKK